MQVTDSIFINEKKKERERKKIWCLQNEAVIAELGWAPSSLTKWTSRSSFKKRMHWGQREVFCCSALKGGFFQCRWFEKKEKRKELPSFLKPIKMYWKDLYIFFFLIRVAVMDRIFESRYADGRVMEICRFYSLEAQKWQQAFPKIGGESAISDFGIHTLTTSTEKSRTARVLSHWRFLLTCNQVSNSTDL